MKRKLFAFGITSAIALFSLPSVASAELLTINNETKQPVTVRIKNIACLQGYGVINPAHGKGVAIDEINQLCKTSCKIQIIKSSDCEGQPIGHFVWDVEKGFTDDIASANSYAITLVNATKTVTLTEALK